MPEAVVEKAPEFMVDGPHGSVIADPTKIPTTEPAKKDDARPEWLDSKFKSPEDLAKAYKELEQKLGAPKAPTVEEVKSKGIDVDKLTAEYTKDGKLSAESMKNLTDAGFTEAHVKAYVDGIAAQRAQVRNEFAEVVGGEEQLAGVLKWAETNLSDAEKDAYNQLVDAGNAVAAKVMLKDIASRYTAAEGETPSLVDAEVIPGAAGVKAFGSWQEVQEAMKDKRYTSGDPAYHRKIQMRLSISDI